MTIIHKSNLNQGKEEKGLTKNYLKNLLPKVFRSEGDVENFHPSKIEESIIKETGLDEKTANRLTEKVVRRIISSGITFLSGPHIREIVCSVLSEQHFEDKRKLYTRIGMPLMDYEAILEKGVKENANQDRNPESIHHWAANRISEEYALLRILDSEESKAHLYGDIHIHMLRYFDLRPFCVDGSTKIPILDKNGVLHYTQARNFDIFFKQDEDYVDVSKENLFFNTPSGIQQLKYITRKKVKERLYRIVSSKGKEIILSKDHNVMIFNENVPQEVPVNRLQIGDKLKILNSELIHKNVNEINLITALIQACPMELLENVYVKNLREDVLIKKQDYSYSWEDVFHKAEILNYPRSWERGSIPILQAVNLINEYSIDLTNIEIGVMGSPYSLPALFPLNPLLLRLIGYFLSEGSYNYQENLNYNLVLSSKDDRILDDMKRCIEDSFNTYITPSFIPDKTPQIIFGGKIIYLLFRYVFGINPLSENKSLNDLFYNLSDVNLKFLLTGLYSGDGHIVYRPHKSDCSITYTSKSKSLIDYLSLIMATHDIRFSIKKEYYEYKIDEYQGEGLKYRIHVYGHKNISRFYSLMSFKQQEKQEKLETFLSKHQPTYSESDLPFEFVQEINLVNPSHLFVYDFTLKGNRNWKEHTFYAENILIHNCQEWDARMILEHGLPPVDSWAHCSKSGPAGSLRVAVTHLAKWLGIIQGEFSGGQGYDYITTFLAPYARGISNREIEQSMQCLIFETNQIFAARGGQVPFTSLSCTPTVTEGLLNIPAVGPHGKIIGTYGDYKEECLKLFDALTEVYIKGDHNGKLFAFPKHEIKIKKEWLKEFEPSYLKVVEEAVKMGSPYFLNMCPEWMPDEIHSQCCRKFLSGNEIISRCVLDPEKRKKANIWENYVTIGSLQSVSLNLPRYAYMSNNEDEYFNELDEKMELCACILIKKWKLMERRLKSGHLPLCSGKIKGKPIFNINDQNLSVGFTGLNEAVKSLTGDELHENNNAYNLGKKILNFMVAKCNTMTEREGYSFSLWEQPSESTSNRLAKLDLKHFPKKAIPQSSGNSAYYTNSDHIRYDAKIPLSKRIQLQGNYHPIVNGGVITHIWLGEQQPDIEGLWELTKNICLNTNTAYFAYTTDFTYCPFCRKMFRGGQWKCPECNSPEVKVYSRITGYYSEVDRYNAGKRAEWDARKRENISR
ncbi:MAG: anaerobic ribonucleoside-triphosphate reductase [Candidatus Lokiarchaeota archaeon]|nr:anaerobic ribonucleoside-triphosphate reductase [Candidatus Lokiarchaeota archaeon]MBD3340025.1 anaerobic ribonucleoside-triphosphate reductase [Candidatus Lokiarchaeota archaeon]